MRLSLSCISCLSWFFAVALCFGESTTRIQRRAAAEAATAQNAVGELTYSVDGSHPAAVLRVGTSDNGTVLVSDPYAIHVAPRRRLAVGEYGISVDEGPYTMTSDGAINLATNVLDGVVTNRITIRPIDPTVKLASVTWDLASGGAVGRIREITEDLATLTTRTTYEELPPPSPPEAGWAVLRGVTVWAWAGERRAETWDTTTADLAIVDSMGETTMSGLRRWVADRYDGRTGEEWSLYPAQHRINFAGQTVFWTSGGALRSQVDAGVWTYVASGVPVLKIVSGVATNNATSDLDVLAMQYDMDNDQMILDVNAALGVPVYINSCDDLTDQLWTRVVGQTSSYPATVSVDGIPAYRVTVPLDPEASACFYRVSATIEGGEGGERSIQIGGDATALYIAGERCAWTNLTVNGATLRVLAVQPTE